MSRTRPPLLPPPPPPQVFALAKAIARMMAEDQAASRLPPAKRGT